MVHFKVTNGVETRRFQVNPGELTFQQLKERINALFPDTAKEEASSLTLRYRDAEGDVITLSSDEEFQEALSDLPSDHVWKLHIASPHVKRQCRRRPATNFFLDHLLEPSWMRPAEQTEDLFDFLLGLSNSHSTKAEEKETPAAATTGSEQTAGEPATSETETPQDTTEGSSDPSPNEGDEEEVKSKQSGATSESTESTESRGPQCYCVKTVRLHDPFLFSGGLFGPPRLFSTPAMYQLTWGRPRCCSLSSACA